MGSQKLTKMMANNPLEQASTFEFHALDNPGLPSLSSKAVSERLQKWNLDQHANMLKFRFDQPFERLNAADFIRDFFSDPTVAASFKVVDSSGRWQEGPGAPSAVEYQQLNTTITSMSFFDLLKSEELEGGPIVSEDGKIAATFEEWVEGMCLQDRLRSALANPESEDFDVFSEAQRRELITTIFRHLVLGGGMNQWDESIEPYVEATRGFYKDLLRFAASGTVVLSDRVLCTQLWQAKPFVIFNAVCSVRKNPETNKVEITTIAYKVESVQAKTNLFGQPYSPNNLCLLCVDPVPRTVTCYYFSWYNSLA